MANRVQEFKTRLNQIRHAMDCGDELGTRCQIISLIAAKEPLLRDVPEQIRFKLEGDFASLITEYNCDPSSKYNIEVG